MLVDRAAEDLLERDLDDTELDDEDFSESVVSVDAGDVPAFCTLTLMRFGVLPARELVSLGSIPRGRMRTLDRCFAGERDLVGTTPGEAEELDFIRPRVDAHDEVDVSLACF